MTADGVHPRAAKLFDEHAAGLLRYLCRRVDAETAADVVSATFETVLTDATPHDAQRGSERAWLFGIATNHLRHHLRSTSRERTALERAPFHLLPTTAEPESDQVVSRVAAAGQVRRLAAGIQALEPRDRELLLLVSWGELTPAEAAVALHIPAGTARSRLHRTRRLLRNAAGSTHPQEN